MDRPPPSALSGHDGQGGPLQQPSFSSTRTGPDHPITWRFHIETLADGHFDYSISVFTHPLLNEPMMAVNEPVIRKGAIELCQCECYMVFVHEGQFGDREHLLPVVFSSLETLEHHIKHSGCASSQLIEAMTCERSLDLKITLATALSYLSISTKQEHTPCQILRASCTPFDSSSDRPHRPSTPSPQLIGLVERSHSADHPARTVSTLQLQNESIMASAVSAATEPLQREISTLQHQCAEMTVRLQGHLQYYLVHFDARGYTSPAYFYRVSNFLPTSQDIRKWARRRYDMPDMKDSSKVELKMESGEIYEDWRAHEEEFAVKTREVNEVVKISIKLRPIHQPAPPPSRVGPTNRATSVNTAIFSGDRAAIARDVTQHHAAVQTTLENPANLPSSIQTINQSATQTTIRSSTKPADPPPHSAALAPPQPNITIPCVSSRQSISRLVRRAIQHSNGDIHGTAIEQGSPPPAQSAPAMRPPAPAPDPRGPPISQPVAADDLSRRLGLLAQQVKRPYVPVADRRRRMAIWETVESPGVVRIPEPMDRTTEIRYKRAEGQRSGQAPETEEGRGTEFGGEGVVVESERDLSIFRNLGPNMLGLEDRGDAHDRVSDGPTDKRPLQQNDNGVVTYLVYSDGEDEGSDQGVKSGETTGQQDPSSIPSRVDRHSATSRSNSSIRPDPVPIPDAMRPMSVRGKNPELLHGGVALLEGTSGRAELEGFRVQQNPTIKLQGHTDTLTPTTAVQTPRSRPAALAALRSDLLPSAAIATPPLRIVTRRNFEWTPRQARSTKPADTPTSPPKAAKPLPVVPTPITSPPQRQE